MKSWSTQELLDHDFSGEPEVEEIYELIDPRTYQVRYVGRSRDVWRRWHEHLNQHGASPMGLWIRGLRLERDAPILQVVCRCAKADAALTEMEHIGKRLAEGCLLFNNKRPVGKRATSDA